jgi:hypothetical protein
VNTFRKIKATYSKYDMKTPVERILENLVFLREHYKTAGNLKEAKEIEWFCDRNLKLSTQTI